MKSCCVLQTKHLRLFLMVGNTLGGFDTIAGVGREEAYRLYREPAEYFYGRCLHIDPRFAGPPGYTTEATQRRQSLSPRT